MDNDFLISVKNLSFSRENRYILDNINLQIRRGKVTAIMGPSGIGKTTLLKLIGAQLQPQSGEVLFRENNIHQMKQEELYRTRKEMSILFQSGALFSDMSVFDNVAFPLREEEKLNEKEITKQVLITLESVGLRGAKDLMPSELSGGMTRRVAFARSIIAKPELMMFDEPFAGQDPISMGVLVSLIKKVKEMKKTIIIVSHDIQETLSVADYVYIIYNASIIAEGTPNDVNGSKSAQVQQFINGWSDGPIKFHHRANTSLEQDLANLEKV